MNYPTFLIGEIWFDLQDMSSCVGPIFGDVIKGLLLVLGPFLLILRLGLGRVGLRAYFLNPISLILHVNYKLFMRW